jgi:oligopeptide transport system substrate-binding protein
MRMMKDFFNAHMKGLAKQVLIGSMLMGASCVLMAANPADPKKVLRTIFPVAETGFDPAFTHDVYSAKVHSVIFETLYSYDYMASPVKLIPKTAAAMPVVSADGLTYTIQLKKGIYFADDPVFKGKKRELTSYDYAYSFKRLLDPNIHSPNSWLFDGRIQGLEALIKAADHGKKFDYDKPVVGIQTPDRYTLVIKLTSPDQNFPMILAHSPAAAVAREVIEKYRDKAGAVMARPIGTGPYLLSRWIPGSRIILKANPNFRGEVWNYTPATAEDKKVAAKLKGMPMPQVGVIDIQVIEEAQSRWLAFKKNETDLVEVENEYALQALDGDKLKPELAKQGIQLSRIPDPLITYQYWNMQNPVVGGFSKDKIALRRAMAMAFNHQNYISIILKGDGVKLEQLIPPGIVGYSAGYKSNTPYSVKAANLLLDRYGYKVGADGYRTLPNGKPLVIELLTRPDTRAQQGAEFWKKTLDGIHVKMEGKSMPFAEGLKLEKQCKTMFKGSAWIADYPDADNFMQLFYGKNINVTNNGCFKHPEFDRLYEKAQKMPASPERDALYRQMSRIIEVNMAVMPITTTYRNALSQPKVIGYKKHPILSSEWASIDIDLKK